MPFRVSFFFAESNARNCGWSESFWSLLSNLNQVQAATDLLQPIMLAFRGNPVQCPYARISTVGVTRQVSIRNYQPFPYVLPVSSSPVPADFQNTALLMKLTALPNYITQQWLRGCPDAEVSNAGQYTPDSYFLNGFNALVAALTNASNGWALQKLDPGQPKKFISNVTTTGLITCAGHGLATDDNTRIRGARSVAGLDGVWRVTVLTADTFQIRTTQTFNVASANLSNATSQKQAHTYVSIGGATIVRATGHRTGRPFGLATGRRKRQTA